MRRKRVVVLEDNVRDFQKLSKHLRGFGYAVELVGSIHEAIAAAVEGADKFVFDIRLIEDDVQDKTGLLAIKPVLRARPSACVVVWSAYARDFDELARALGAHGVVEKVKSGAAEIAIENHFLRFDASMNRMRFFIRRLWLPLSLGSAFSATALRIGFSLSFLTPTGSGLLPLALSAIYVLTVSYAKWAGDPDFAGSRLFGRYTAVRGWVLTAILGGLFYDAVKKLFFGA